MKQRWINVLLEDVIVKIGVVGNFSDDNFELILKGKVIFEN